MVNIMRNFGITFTLLVLCLVFVTSCSSANTDKFDDKTIDKIIAKYYSLNNKFEEVTFKYDSSFFDDLIKRAPEERVKNIRGLSFLVKLNGEGKLSIAVENVPQNISDEEKKYVNKVISAVKQQINGLFQSLGPVFGGILNPQKYDIKIIGERRGKLVIEDMLKNSNLKDKLYFKKDYILEKWETFMGGRKISEMKPSLKKKDTQFFIVGIDAELFYPQRLTTGMEIKYKEYNGLSLPYEIKNYSFSEGKKYGSIFTLEPKEIKF